MDVAEAGQQTAATGETERQNGNENSRMEQTQPKPRLITTTEKPQPVGVQLQIQGNVSNSQIRQSNTQAPPAPMTFRTSAKEPQGTIRPITTIVGSAQRKRSRVGEEGTQLPVFSTTKIHECVNIMNIHIENLHKTGQRGNTGIVRAQMAETMKELMSESTNLLAKVVNAQECQLSYLKAEKETKNKITSLLEENNCIKQQVIELQTKLLHKEQGEKQQIPPSYAQVTGKNVATNIILGRQMPLPHVSQSIKHAPSECIIIFKADEKGEMKNKKEQETFRAEVKGLLNDDELQGISAIRPTRFGGHTLIFQSEEYRNKVYNKLKEKEKERGIDEAVSKMVAPIKRVAKVVCKETPDGLSIEQIKTDMYGRHNPALEVVNPENRTGKIYRTRLGLIFELSGQEMAAIQSQGWRIRCDLGREIRVEEFISLQQCYACAKFGHSAHECRAEAEACRLCGKSGHAGKECPDKDNKESWRCVNCQRMNQLKNLNLNTQHAAAQLHKCPVAQQQKNIRKIQLAATGVFTTPINKGDETLKDKLKNIDEQQLPSRARNGHTQYETKRNNRSRSTMRRRNNIANNVRANLRNESKQSGRRGTAEQEYGNPCVQRMHKEPQPQLDDGWKVVGRRQNRGSESSNQRGRRSEMQVRGSGGGQIEDDEELREMETEIWPDEDAE